MRLLPAIVFLGFSSVAQAGSLTLTVTIGGVATEYGIDVPDAELTRVIQSYRTLYGRDAKAETAENPAVPAATDAEIVHQIVRDMVVRLQSDDANQRQRAAARQAVENVRPFAATPRQPVRRQ